MIVLVENKRTNNPHSFCDDYFKWHYPHKQSSQIVWWFFVRVFSTKTIITKFVMNVCLKINAQRIRIHFVLIVSVENICTNNPHTFCDDCFSCKQMQKESSQILWWLFTWNQRTKNPHKFCDDCLCGYFQVKQSSQNVWGFFVRLFSTKAIITNFVRILCADIFKWKYHHKFCEDSLYLYFQANNHHKICDDCFFENKRTKNPHTFCADSFTWKYLHKQSSQILWCSRLRVACSW